MNDVSAGSAVYNALSFSIGLVSIFFVTVCYGRLDFLDELVHFFPPVVIYVTTTSVYF